MALLYVCDCGQKKVFEDKEGLVEMGLSQKLYCKGECEDKVKAFLGERDQLHDKVVKIWDKEMKVLNKKHGKDFILPDQP